MKLHGELSKKLTAVERLVSPRPTLKWISYHNDCSYVRSYVMYMYHSSYRSQLLHEFDYVYMT